MLFSLFHYLQQSLDSHHTFRKLCPHRNGEFKRCVAGWCEPARSQKQVILSLQLNTRKTLKVSQHDVASVASLLASALSQAKGNVELFALLFSYNLCKEAMKCLSC